MRILVTGATGFLGQRLVKELAKAHEVLAFGRSNADLPASFVEGDLLDAPSVDSLKKRTFDVVYHLAACLDESDPKLWEINVEGTRRLLEACKGKKLERFILVGPSGVLGETNTPAREDAAYNPGTLYEKSKVEAEHLVMDYRLKHQVNYTIIRAPIIYGPNRFWKQIFSAARHGFPLIGQGHNLFHLVYVDDVVDALVLALKPVARNQIYHVAGPDVKTYKETYEMICEALGVPMTKATVPAALMKGVAFAHEVQSKAMGMRPNVTLMRASIERLIRNRVLDISKAKRDLGFKPKYTLARGLAKTVKELAKGAA
jgi:nucleoside-diphosphate-sugar epimerase